MYWWLIWVFLVVVLLGGVICVCVVCCVLCGSSSFCRICRWRWGVWLDRRVVWVVCGCRWGCCSCGWWVMCIGCWLGSSLCSIRCCGFCWVCCWWGWFFWVCLLFCVVVGCCFREFGVFVEVGRRICVFWGIFYGLFGWVWWWFDVGRGFLLVCWWFWVGCCFLVLSRGLVVWGILVVCDFIWLVFFWVFWLDVLLGCGV